MAKGFRPALESTRPKVRETQGNLLGAALGGDDSSALQKKKLPFEKPPKALKGENRGKQTEEITVYQSPISVKGHQAVKHWRPYSPSL